FTGGVWDRDRVQDVPLERRRGGTGALTRSARHLRGLLPPARQEGDDLAEVVEGAEVLRLDGRGGGQALLQGGEDLDALDGVDAQVGVQGHVQVQHLRGVTRLLRDHLQQHTGDGGVCVRGRGRRGCDRRRGRPWGL